MLVFPQGPRCVGLCAAALRLLPTCCSRLLDNGTTVANEQRSPFGKHQQSSVSCWAELLHFERL
jgi:hypothetical protein